MLAFSGKYFSWIIVIIFWEIVVLAPSLATCGRQLPTNHPVAALALTTRVGKILSTRVAKTTRVGKILTTRVDKILTTRVGKRLTTRVDKILTTRVGKILTTRVGKILVRFPCPLADGSDFFKVRRGPCLVFYTQCIAILLSKS